MPRSSAKKPPARPASRHVDAVVFSAAMLLGDIEVIDIPFEHRGRTWAVHGASHGGTVLHRLRYAARPPSVRL